jgi:UDP-glucuronate 4-epimerase
MAMFLFTQAILEGKPLDLYNNGQIRRDFTYIDDVIEGIVRIMEIPPPANPSWFDAPDCSTSYAPWRIYNIGGNRPVPIMDLVAALEKEIDKKAILNPMPMQPGDVKETWADVSPLSRDTGFIPSTTLSEGVKRFWEWYRRYYKL